MPQIIIICIILTFIGVLYLKQKRGHVIVQEWQSGLFYNRGKFISILKAGHYGYWKDKQLITVIDHRETQLTLSGQELLSQDNVAIKVSLIIFYKVLDAKLATQTTQNYYNSLYTSAQLALREEVIKLPIDELLTNRHKLGPMVLETLSVQAKDWGLEIRKVDLRDLTFSGELKKVFAELVKAQKEGQAALERARGESAALRHLANAAKLLENNPTLFNLRALLASSSGTQNNLVLNLPNMATSEKKSEN